MNEEYEFIEISNLDMFFFGLFFFAVGCVVGWYFTR